MNPALDIATSTEVVIPTEKMRCGSPRYDPGGGGINVARVVKTLGGAAFAVFPAGGPSGQSLEGLLARQGVPHIRIPVEGVTRESFTVDEQRSGQQYRFVLPGPSLIETEQRTCLENLAGYLAGARFLVASGSLPPGVRADFFQDVADLAAGQGVRFILDTSGEALRLTRRGVYLLKPSVRELRECVGRELSSEAEQIQAARDLITEKRAEVVVVSLGAKGALLVTERRYERFAPIEVPIRSAVGAGDSMVAAIALGLVRGMELQQAVRFGMAAGAATLMTPGTELCRRDDVEKLYLEQSPNGNT
ncbi:1-phosphofructokinase family hexose kinase [Microvirga sp. c23x22]|uniref:Phosphofructokinase n=2 Tax=Microvirga terricola TaxID=2719797 RepID=A0ABX0VEF7_9HYPH|nr:1-phosphofructokinase family hexose kinase [Microvirga terricola]